MVNEILDLSKIEAGRMQLHLESTDLAALLADTAASFEAAASKNGNKIVCQISEQVGVAWCDATKFRNMLGQLVDNAIKFTEGGSIGLHAERDRGETGDVLMVHVTDTGIGIAPDKITGLFEKFTVIDDTSTSKYGGTGLGLALSQKLCKLMGGEILVQSEVGVGSRFTIRMPLPATPLSQVNHPRIHNEPRGPAHPEATLVPDHASLPSLQAASH
jgi:signal transduction histidine kinase